MTGSGLAILETSGLVVRTIIYFKVVIKSELSNSNIIGKLQTYYRGDKSIEGSRPLGELIEQIRLQKGGDLIGETTLARAAGYMAHDGRGDSVERCWSQGRAFNREFPKEIDRLD